MSVNRYRTICYVDGFNLYYGLREAGLRDCYWLNVRELASKLVRPPFVLSRTKYFTARVAGAHPHDTPDQAAEREAGRLRQVKFLDALGTLAAFDIIEGHYLLKRVHCRACNAEFRSPEEKMTDVRIATELLTDAFLGRYDSAIIISADADLVPPIQAVKSHFPEKRIVVAFPPRRKSYHLARAADATIDIWPRVLARCQLPAEMRLQNGAVLSRPEEWQ